MNILITGCAGFIGTDFTRYMLDKHPTWTVIGVDALTYAADIGALEETKARYGARLCFYHADICDKKTMSQIFVAHRPDIVVNLAAESHVDRSIEAPDIFVRTNVLGTGVLLDLALAHGTQRFHQVSTDEVYGDLPLDSTERFNETSPLMPNSPYSASKASADLLVLSYYKTYGLPVTISRSSNNYGAHQHREKLIPATISRALAGERVLLYGDGKNRRNWISVLDHCRAIDLILEKGSVGEIYNIASSTEIANIDLVCRILEALKCPPTRIAFVPDRKGHDRKYALDTTKIERELGFFSEIPFDTGLRDTIFYYQSQYKK